MCSHKICENEYFQESTTVFINLKKTKTNQNKPTQSVFLVSPADLVLHTLGSI